MRYGIVIYPSGMVSDIARLRSQELDLHCSGQQFQKCLSLHRFSSPDVAFGHYALYYVEVLTLLIERVYCRSCIYLDTEWVNTMISFAL